MVGAERRTIVEVAQHTPRRSAAVDGSTRSHADSQGFSSWSGEEELRYPPIVMGSIKTNSSNIMQLFCGAGDLLVLTVVELLLGSAGQATGIVRRLQLL